MHKFYNTERNIDKEIKKEIISFNVIIADQDIETFEKLSRIKSNYNFINLSSDFAVSFVMEYEKVDAIIIGKKISNLDKIKEKARRKKINVYVIGKDIKFPLDEEELEKVLAREIDSKIRKKKDRSKLSIGRYINIFFKRKLERAGTPAKISSNSKVVSKTSKNLTPPDNKNNKNNKENKKIDSTCKLNSIREYSCKIGENENKNLSIGGDFEKEVSSSREKLEFKSSDCFNNGAVKAIKQKVIVFTKAKGGVGSTILSIFLSCMFVKMKTLLVDLNFSEGGGDIGYYLDIPKTPNMMNFMDGYSRSSMDNSIFNLRNSLDIMQSPPTYEQARKIELQDIYGLVDVARKKYHLIIFDLPNQVNDFWLGVVDLADLLIMVSDYTLGSIGRLISINNKFVYSDLEKILVINKYDGSNGSVVSRDQLRQFFGLNKFVYLDETKMLRGRSDFSNFDFGNFQNFNNLTDKVLDLLTCD